MIKFGRGTILLLVAALAAVSDAAVMQMDSKSMADTKLSDLAVPSLVIRKSARVLEVHDRGRLVRVFKTALGFSPVLDKEVEGDGRTPEGEFYVFTKNPKSRFHLSLGLSYPAPDDASRGLAGGLVSREEHDEIIRAFAEKGMPPQKTKLGGEIYIHGGGTAGDWTDGCVALDNDEMTELFEAIPIGTKVTILR